MSSPAAVAKEKLRHCLAEVIHPSTLSVVSVYWMNIQTLSSQFTFFYFFACPPTLEREMWAMAYFKFSIAGFIANQSAQQGALCPESGPLHSSAQAELSRGPSCAPSPSTQDLSWGTYATSHEIRFLSSLPSHNFPSYFRHLLSHMNSKIILSNFGTINKRILEVFLNLSS